jgi:hypothetical protein
MKSTKDPVMSAGGCAFDGAQIALLPITDVAHIVHGPLCREFLGQPGHAVFWRGFIPHRHDHRFDRAGHYYGTFKKTLVPCHQTGD